VPAADRGSKEFSESCEIPRYAGCRRRTTSLIQIGAKGDVQFGGVG
jgi:hypothetical protein